MSTDLPDLNINEHVDLGDRLHDTVAYLRLLKDSPFWRVDSSSVRDIISDLTPRQSRWLLADIGDRMQIESDADVLQLPVAMPEKLVARANEIYTFVIEVKPLPKRLIFATMAHPLSREAAH